MMKYILISLLSLLPFVAISQIELVGYVSTFGGGSYPTHLDSLGKGGFRVVADATERNAITQLRRSVGMVVMQLSDTTLYRLRAPITGNDWVKVVNTTLIDSLITDLQTQIDAFSASNGLTMVGSDIRLGGTLGANTTIAGSGFGLTLTNSNKFSLQSTGIGNIEGGTGLSLSTDTGDLSLDGPVMIGDTSNVSFPGAQYRADYSTNYTIRSLIDKGHLTAIIAPIQDSISTAPSGSGVNGRLALWGGSNNLTSNGDILYNSSGYIGLNAIPLSRLYLRQDSIGTGFTADGGFQLENLTPSISGSQQSSPYQMFTYSAYASVPATSQTNRWRMWIEGIQGTNNSTGRFRFQSSIGGGAYTTPFMFETQGNLTMTGNLEMSNNQRIRFNQTGFIGYSITTAGSTSGALRVSNFSGLPLTSTSSTIIEMGVGDNFAPTSGNANYSTFYINPTINQTGGANGVTRGLHIEPTLTAASDFRAIGIVMGSSSHFAIRQSGSNAINYFEGKAGIGVIAPTARLHLGAGTSSLSPFNFTAGVNLTTPVAGAMEWDGTNLFVTQTTGPTRKTIAYTTDITATNLSFTGTTQIIELANSAGTDVVFKGVDIGLTKVTGTKDTLYLTKIEHWGEVSINGGSTSVTAGSPERPDEDTPGTPTASLSSEFTQSASTVTYIGATGQGEIKGTISFSPSATGDYLVSLYQEGVEVSVTEIRLTATASEYITVSVPTASVNITTNDTFELKIEPVSGSSTITIHKYNVYARKIY